MRTRPRSIGWLAAIAVAGPACSSGDEQGVVILATGPCESLTTNLPTLVAGISVFDDSVAQGDLDALAAELTALAARSSFAEVCPPDLTLLGDTLEQLSNIAVDDDASTVRFEAALTLQSAGWAVLGRIDTIVFGSGDPVPVDFSEVCATYDWDRRASYDSHVPATLPDLDDCTVLAMTDRRGMWEHQGDPSSVVPTSFAAWERSTDDQGYPLVPASDLLTRFDAITDPNADLDYMRSTGSYQFASSLSLEPHMPTIQAYGHAYVIYGRGNATSTYVMNPKDFVDDGVLLEYEYGPARDSIKILDCLATDLEGWKLLSFGNRQAYADPFIPFVPDQPGLWAIVAVCATTPDPPVDAAPPDAGWTPDAAMPHDAGWPGVDAPGWPGVDAPGWPGVDAPSWPGTDGPGPGIDAVTPGVDAVQDAGDAGQDAGDAGQDAGGPHDAPIVFHDAVHGAQ